VVVMMAESGTFEDAHLWSGFVMRARSLWWPPDSCWTETTDFRYVERVESGSRYQALTRKLLKAHCNNARNDSKRHNLRFGTQCRTSEHLAFSTRERKTQLLRDGLRR
jgi:hypothetical protein